MDITRQQLPSFAYLVRFQWVFLGTAMGEELYLRNRFRRNVVFTFFRSATQRFLIWSMMYVHNGAFFIRVYRMWRILIKHDDNMWHPG